MTVANPYFDDAGALPGQALSWNFVDNGGTVITSPADFNLNVGYPNLDGVDTGHTGSQFQLGREDDATEIVYETDAEYVRSLSQLTGTVPDFATNLEVRYRKSLDAAGKGSTWKMQIWVTGAMEYEDPIEPGDDTTSTWSYDVTGLVGTEVLIEIKMVQGVASLTGAMMLLGYEEATEVTWGEFSDGATVATPRTIGKTNGTNFNEWGYISRYAVDGVPSWIRMMEGRNGISSTYDRCFVTRAAYRAGDENAYFCWWTQGDLLEVRDENDVVITTFNRPANSGPGVYRAWWGGVTAVNVETGAFVWTTIADWDVPIDSNTNDLRPMNIAWGGPDNEDLVVGYVMTTQTTSAPVPTPVFGSAVQAVFNNIDYANVGNSAVSAPWLIKINPTNGDAASADAHVANYNDAVAGAGTPYRAFVAADRFNIFNFVWNPTTQLWYMSANHSGYSSLGVNGAVIGRGRPGEIPTRGTDNFGGPGSVKPYLCTYDANFDPVNVITVVTTNLNNGNNRYAYNHSVHLVPGSGDVMWGWQNMSTSPAIDMERQGVDGNYSGGPYIPSDQTTFNSVILRLDSLLEVVWEASAYASPHTGLGRGRSIQMTPYPGDSSRMLAMVGHQGVNTTFNDTANLFGSAPVTFDSQQAFCVGFDLATGAYSDAREISPESTNAVGTAITIKTAESGPNAGRPMAAALFGASGTEVNAGFRDKAGVRQVNNKDFWVNNGANPPNYGVGGTAGHFIYALDDTGELDPPNCFPYLSSNNNVTAANTWPLDLVHL